MQTAIVEPGAAIVSVLALGFAAVVGGAAGRVVLRSAGATVSGCRLVVLLCATAAAALMTHGEPVVQLAYLGVAAAVGQELVERAARSSDDGTY